MNTTGREPQLGGQPQGNEPMLGGEGSKKRIVETNGNGHREVE